MPVPLDTIRDAFPALESGFAFLENAGGSQVPRTVIEAMGRFMTESYVQTGAGYPHSDRATAAQQQARTFVGTLVGARDGDAVVMGQSSTLLLNRLAASIGDALDIGAADEVVVSTANHESHVGPWARWEKRGATIRWWRGDPVTGVPSLSALLPLLGEATKVVAFSWTSNLLGDIQPVAEIVKAVRAKAPNARVVVDAVAYAPHRRIAFAECGADALVFSAYKVYGPHQAYLVVREDLAASLHGENHFFLPNRLPYAFELGCQSYEACAGVVALGEYCTRTFGGVAEAFESFAAYEEPLQTVLVDYLRSKSAVRVVGPLTGDPNARVATISFVHASRCSAEIAGLAHQAGIGIRNGHMYAYRLCEELGIRSDDGVVRVSAVHYNSPEEIMRLVEALDPIL
ncbi:MAG: aminotransferase class V-fold PLP-dependent enzyme [Fimbriimonadaceae bacterium]|nr:aminotransferase class V-fold PLP-dependent enzyme [Fimbriimonadaceae bacterium]